MGDQGKQPLHVGGIGKALTLAITTVVAVLLLSGFAGAMSPVPRSTSPPPVVIARPPPPTTTTNISVGKSPEGVALDLSNGRVFVANYASKTVSVIKDSSVLTTITVGTNPTIIVYDAKNALLVRSELGQ